jgi:hypothetical protein
MQEVRLKNDYRRALDTAVSHSISGILTPLSLCELVDL